MQFEASLYMAVFAHKLFMPAVVDQAFRTLAAMGTLFAITSRFLHGAPGPPKGNQDPNPDPGPEPEPGQGPTPEKPPQPEGDPQPEGEAPLPATGIVLATELATELATSVVKSMTDWQEAGQPTWAWTPASPRSEAATTELVCIPAVAARMVRGLKFGCERPIWKTKSK